VVKFGEFIMILELHRQGLKVAAIARQLGVDRKTVRKYISRGLEPPAYGPRSLRQKSTDPFLPYLGERLTAFPGLTAVRLWRELRERGYAGAKSGNRGLNLGIVQAWQPARFLAIRGRPRTRPGNIFRRRARCRD